jgi:nucleoside-diphosphate-sugar epimerase
MPESSVLLTGASGFIGSALLQRLRESASTVEALSWREGPMLFQKSLAAGCKVVHLAGLAHAGKGRFSREDYLRVNTEYPVALAEQAIAAGA